MVYGSPGMGFYLRGAGRGFRLSRCIIARRPGTNRLISTASDGAHFTSTAGDIIVEGCDFSGQGDDSLNLASHWLEVREKQDRRTLVLERRGGEPVLNGAEFIVRRRHSLEEVGRARVANVVSEATGRVVVTTESDLPERVAAGDLAGNLSQTNARFAVRNNVFHDHRGRGMLIQAPNGIVESNLVANVTGAAISLTADALKFLEGVGCQGVLVRNNQLTGCNYGGETGPEARHVACLNVVGAVASGVSFTSVHSDVVLEGNSIRNTPGPAILVASARTVVVQGNTIEDAFLHPPGATAARTGIPMKGAIVIARASDVDVVGNTIRSSRKSHAAAVHVDRKSTSDVRVAHNRSN